MILFFLPGYDFGPERPDEGFFYYTGFRDWWRIPLVYPFQIHVIDCFDSGSLEKHKTPSLVAYSESTQLLSEVTAFCDYRDYWLFKDTQSFSKRKSPLEWEKVIENVALSTTENFFRRTWKKFHKNVFYTSIILPWRSRYHVQPWNVLGQNIICCFCAHRLPDDSNFWNELRRGAR